jgi:hypothetical protein
MKQRSNRPVYCPVARMGRAHEPMSSPGNGAPAVGRRPAKQRSRCNSAPGGYGVRLWALVLLLMVPLQGFSADTSHRPGDDGAWLPIKASRRALIQSLAAQALLDVSRARRQIQQHHDGAAIQDLRETRTLFDLMGAAHPAGRVKALIRYLKTVLNGGDNRQSLPDLLPIYTALDAMRDSPAVRAARRHLDAAKHALEKPDVQTAEQQLDAASKALSIDSIDFPLDAAREDLSVVLHNLLRRQTVGNSRLQSMEHDLLSIAGGSESDARS